MTKRFFLISLVFSFFLLSSTALWSQGEVDTYNISRRRLSGTARFCSMAGAFSALGGDVSAVERNPAIAATFHSYDLCFTGGLETDFTNSVWQNTNNTEHNGVLNVNGFQSGIAFPFFNREKDKGFTFLLNVSTPYKIKRPISCMRTAYSDFSLADFTAYSTLDNLTTNNLTAVGDYDPYDAGINWLSVLGYNAGWIVPANNSNHGPYDTSFLYPQNGEYKAFGPTNTLIDIMESSNNVETDIAFGYNWQDRLYFGFSLNFSKIDYRMQSRYRESFIDNDYLELENSLNTFGTGMGVSFGFIGRPTDYLRLAFAVHSPTLFYLTDRYNARASSCYSYGLDKNGNRLPKEDWYYSAYTPEEALTSYRILTPARVVLGAAYTFFDKGLVSFDYELLPFAGMKIFNNVGVASVYKIENAAIRHNYGIQQSIRLGGEYRLTKRVALRAGYMLQTSPLKNRKGLRVGNDSYSEVSVLTSGTIPHYIIPGAEHTFTCGTGCLLPWNLYLDVAYMFKTQKNDLYAFPTITNKEGSVLVHSGAPAFFTAKSHNVLFTLGYRM